MLDAAIAHARTWDGVEMVHLSVSERAQPARRLYESAGFREWGREPRAVQWQGEFADEFHMALDLRAPTRGS
jgi:RimJ/RimL family protein N-acetyltransferase